MFIFAVPFSNRQHSKFVPNVSDLCKKLTKLREIVKNFLIIFQLFSFKRWNFFSNSWTIVFLKREQFTSYGTSLGQNVSCKNCSLPRWKKGSRQCDRI